MNWTAHMNRWRFVGVQLRILSVKVYLVMGVIALAVGFQLCNRSMGINALMVAAIIMLAIIGLIVLFALLSFARGNRFNNDNTIYYQIANKHLEVRAGPTASTEKLENLEVDCVKKGFMRLNRLSTPKRGLIIFFDDKATLLQAKKMLLGTMPLSDKPSSYNQASDTYH